MSRSTAVGVVRRQVVLQDARAGGRREATRAEVVLEGNRDAEKGHPIPVGAPPVEGCGLGQCLFGGDGVEGVHRRIGRGDASERCRGKPRPRTFLQPHRAGDRTQQSRAAASREDSWYFEESALEVRLGRLRDSLSPIERWLRHIVAPRANSGEGVRRRRDAGGRDLLHLVGVGQEVRQLRREEILLLLSQLESRERAIRSMSARVKSPAMRAIVARKMVQRFTGSPVRA